jgi:hypothetical protein
MFSSDGFQPLGLLRTLQGDIMVWSGFILLALVCWFFARRMITASASDGSLDAAAAISARRTARTIFATACALSVLALGWRAATVAAINRMPRADADRSGVYERMKNNIEPADKK